MSSDVFRLRDPKPKQDNRELIDPREKLYYIYIFLLFYILMLTNHPTHFGGYFLKKTQKNTFNYEF